MTYTSIDSVIEARLGTNVWGDPNYDGMQQLSRSEKIDLVLQILADAQADGLISRAEDADLSKVWDRLPQGLDDLVEAAEVFWGSRPPSIFNPDGRSPFSSAPVYPGRQLGRVHGLSLPPPSCGGYSCGGNSGTGGLGSGGNGGNSGTGGLGSGGSGGNSGTGGLGSGGARSPGNSGTGGLGG